MRVDRLLGGQGLEEDSPAGRQKFERRMEARRLGPGDGKNLKALRRGSCLGSEEFKKEKLETIEGKIGEHDLGELRLETAQAKAQRIIVEELGRLGWREAGLMARRKHDPGKVQIAPRLRKETTLTVKQIAERGVGTRTTQNAS